jgi:hypothetical protein
MAWLLDKRIFVAKTSRAKRMWVLRHENRRIQMGVAKMTRNGIIKLAREAGWPEIYGEPIFTIRMNEDEFFRFAALVAETEREACAMVAESTICDTHIPTGVKIYGTRVAAAIRARGDK